jgi:hypothetical protein
MVVLTPLDIPKLEPDSWDVFWDLWNEHATHLVPDETVFAIDPLSNREYNDHLCKGIDIFVKESHALNRYEAPFVDIKNKLPNMHKQIESLPFIDFTYKIRLLDFPNDVWAHTDDNADAWIVRNIFHYSDTGPWFVTSPNSDNKTYLTLPVETNWFAFNDKHCWHGATYNPNCTTIVIQIFYDNGKWQQLIPLLQRSANKFKDYVIRLP